MKTGRKRIYLRLNTKCIIQHIIAIFLLVFTTLPIHAQRLVEVSKGFSGTSINTTVFRNNALTTFQDEQYICYYDNEGYLVVGKRKLNSDAWTLKRTPYQGNINDAHNVACMAVDKDGYIHLAFDHHGHPLNYCRSTTPYSLDMGDKINMTGDNEHNVTYPEFYTLHNGDLLFVYRSGASGRGNLVMNRYNTDVKQWERLHNNLIDGEDKRNAYWQLYIDKQGTIHLSWVWRETWMVETNHDMCYAQSDDNGLTWHKTNGEQYNLPITQENAEYACIIPQESELINQTSMSTDKDGNPYIATYWRDTDSEIPQYRLIWHDGTSWNNCQVGHRTEPFTLKGGGTKRIPIARPRLVINEQDIYYIFRDEKLGSKVSIAYSNINNTDNWQTKQLTDFSVDAWEPMHDVELWKKQQALHLFVQSSGQGDGETLENKEPQPIYVLEVATDELFR